MRASAVAITGLELPAVEKISASRAEDPFQVTIATLLSARTQDATTYAAADLETANHLSADRIFERRWALTVLEQVFARLGEEYGATGKIQLFERFNNLLTDEYRQSQSEIAREFAMNENAVKQAFHRFRQRYREILRQEIAR